MRSQTNTRTDRKHQGGPEPGSGCPHGGFRPADFDPLAPGNLADPFDELACAREEAPVFYMPKYGMWCVTRYEDVQTVLSDPHTFSSAKMVRVWPAPAETAPHLPDGHPLEGAPVTTDPPRHIGIRRLAQAAFTPKVVRDREPAIREIAHGLVDGFVNQGRVDLVPAYTAEIPPWVVTHLLGVPPGDRETFRHWALEAHDLAFSPPELPPDELLRLSREMVKFDGYIRALIEDRRESPQEDLTSYLVHAQTEEGDPSLTMKELMGVTVSMVTAGSDTTSSLIGHAVYLLLTTPGAWDEVRASRERVPGVVEETLRLYSSARALRRTTTRPTQLGGVDIPEGATIYWHMGSANRDPEVFEDPDSFNAGRANAKRHVAFGSGTHFCLGALLARIEAKVALETLMDRIPNLRLDRDEQLEDADYVPNMFIPSLRTLRVAWD